MTEPNDSQPSLDLLFDEYIYGQLTPENAVFLRDLLLKDTNNEERFALSVLGDFLLRERAVMIQDRKMSVVDELVVSETFRHEMKQWRKPKSPEVSPRTSSNKQSQAKDEKKEKKNESVTRRQPLWPFIVTLIAFFLLLIPAIWNSFDHSEEEMVAEFEPPVVACITELLDPIWSKDATKWLRGQETYNGRISLESGSLALNFASGATAIIQGPSELLIKDGKNVFCTRGAISVHVPPEAVGFCVETPFGKIIDRGTEFFVNVLKESAEVGVEKGRVDLCHESNQTPFSMARTDAIRIGINGKIEKTIYDFGQYRSFTSFYDEVQKRVFELLSQKEIEDRQLDATPNLIARFDFMRNGEDDIDNLAIAGQETIPKLDPTAIRNGSGPLRGTKGILIRGNDSGLNLALPNQLQALTITTSVRIDRFNGGGNVLFASQDHRATPGGILWQFLSNGTIQLHFRDDSDKTLFFETPDILTKSRLGTWTTLSLTFNPKTKCIIFGQDGREISRHEWKNPRPVSLGNSTLGNVTKPMRHFENRSLGGTMSEFRLYSRALTPGEITYSVLR